MTRQRLTLLRLNNFYIKFLPFVLLLPPSVLAAQIADNCSAPLQYLTTPCYVNGDPLAVGSTSANDHVLVNFPLTASGTLGSGGTSLNRWANASQVGSTWGVASQTSSGKIFSAAMLKRHVGLGPDGLGAIYESNIFTGDNISIPMTTAKFVDLVADFNLDVGHTQIAGMDLSNGAASNAARGLPADKALNNTDGEVFSKIAKIGLGDLDIDEAEEHLFVVNLYLKKIHKINITTKTLVASYDIPATDGASGTTMRPFGLEIGGGKLYAGVVYSKENPATLAAQDITTMTASVYQLDLASGIWAVTPVLSFPLDYAKGDVLGSLPSIDKWNVWQDDFAQWQRHNDLSIHPQPILSDMVMDTSGALHLAFMDRAGNQTGFQNNSPNNAVYSGTTDGYTGGDLLRTANIGGVLVLENNGSVGSFTGAGVGNMEGPGNGEFYANDTKSTSHYETSWGGVAMIRSSEQIVLSIMDPFDFTAGGLKVFSTANGSEIRAYQLYRSSGASSPTFGKANGIGGMDLMCVFACTLPSLVVVTQKTPTCTNGIANNNGKITFSSISNADKYFINSGTYSTGTYLTASAIPAGGTDIQTNIPNTGATYTIRFFNGSNTCYKDTTITIYPIECTTCQRNVLYICGNNKPNDAFSYDHGMIDYLRAVGHTVTPATPNGSSVLENAETNTSLGIDNADIIDNGAFQKVIVSHSAANDITNNADLRNVLKNTSKDLLILSTRNLADFDMAQAAGANASANSAGKGDIWIDNNTSTILPTGLSTGSNLIYNDKDALGLDNYAKFVGWGQNLGSGAVIGAYWDDPAGTDKIAYFSYPKGAAMLNSSVAPANRFFLGFLLEGASVYQPQINVADSTNFFTAKGRKILDAALEKTCPCTCDTTLTVSNTTICSGSAVNLFTLATDVLGTLSYSTNGTTWATLSNPTSVTPSVTTTYYIKDTLTNGCFDIDTLIVTLNPAPSTPSVSSPKMNICPATTINLTTIAAALTPSVSGGVFEWHISNSSASALVAMPAAVSTGTYYLFEKSLADCYSASTAVTTAIQSCCPAPICLPVTVVRSH